MYATAHPRDKIYRVKTWDWKHAITAELKLWLLEVTHQLFGYRLTPLQKHMLRERAKMSRKLWLKIMWRDNWQCQIQSPHCTVRAAQVDHKQALFNWGYTEERNLQAACARCNVWKGTKT